MTPPPPPLPDCASPSVRLVTASSDEYLATRSYNSESWKGPMSLAQYLEREDLLAKHVGPAAFTPRVLVDSDERPAEGAIRTILSACESTRRTMLVAHRGLVREAGCDFLSSVYTQKPCRGRGYAARMLHELTLLLVDGSAGDYPTGPLADISILYSDIGPRYYARLGWSPHGSRQITVPVNRPSPPSPDQRSSSYPPVRFLAEDEIADLASDDCRNVRSLLEAVSHTDPDAHFVTHIPSFEMLQWNWIREDCARKSLTTRPITHRGAIVTGPEFDRPGQRVWCYWTRGWAKPGSTPQAGSNQMHILRLVVEALPSLSETDISEEKMPGFRKYACAVGALLRAAQQEAAEWDLDSICLWNPNPLVVSGMVDADPRSVLEERTESSLPALKWLPDLRDGATTRTKIVWVQNEKLGWC